MNYVFYAIVLLAVVFAGFTGTPAEVGNAALDGAKAAVNLVIGLAGPIVLFMGLMQVVQEAGGLKWMARVIRPLMVRLFPDVPPDHPAMGAMIMNIAANALGLGNAATPFGLKAMKELDRLNTSRGTATNAMILFLAINTSGLALLPTGMIAIRRELGAMDPAAIFPTTLFATAMSTVAGVAAAKLLQRLPAFAPPEPENEIDPYEADPDAAEGGSWLPLAGLTAFLLGVVALVYVYEEAASAWILPVLILSMLTVGMVQKVKVYEVFIQGAKEGLQMVVLIIPYLVAILAAVGMFRASGGMDWVTGGISALTAPLGLPGEALPLALLRPLSGSGAFGITAELLKTHGPDSYIGNLVSTMQGSTETTFYVLAVYFGSVNANRIRHAVFAGLTADFFGVVGSVLAVQLLLGGTDDLPSQPVPPPPIEEALPADDE